MHLLRSFCCSTLSTLSSPPSLSFYPPRPTKTPTTNTIKPLNTPRPNTQPPPTVPSPTHFLSSKAHTPTCRPISSTNSSLLSTYPLPPAPRPCAPPRICHSNPNLPTPVIHPTHLDRKSTRLNSSHSQQSRMPSSA